MDEGESMVPLSIRGFWSPVSLLGAVLLAAVVLQTALDADPLFINVLEIAVPAALAITIVYTDRWMEREGFDGDERFRGFSYAIYGLIGMMGLAIWLVILMRLNRARLDEPEFVVIGAGTVGAAAGLLLGVARIRHARALKSVDQQRDQLESFAATVSHDLKNPLNVAMAKIDDIRSEVDHDQLDRTMSTLRRMDEILEGTLELARQGSIVREPQPVDLDTVATEAWEGAATADASLTVEDPGTVPGDEGRLYQLFDNLFANAVEHGGTTVSVQVGRLSDGFYVEDDGPGIPTTIRDRVTERGFSASPEGSGLGLSIVRAIAVAHGWQLVVTNGDAGGARIEFRDVTG